MKNKVLNVAATVLALLTEAWVMRLCGINKWCDIFGYIVVTVVVPIISVPWIIFRMWLGYIVGESNGTAPNGKRERYDDAASGSRGDTQQTQCDAERERFDDELRANCERVRKEEQRRADAARRTFLFFMSALAAKIAKADGRVDASEIAVIERAFERFGLSETQRRFCIGIFRNHVSSETTISSLARQMSDASLSAELKALIYEILWNVACADGVLTRGEKEALQLISRMLGLNSYDRYYRQRVDHANDDARSERQDRAQRSARMALGDAYEILGCRASCTDAEVKSAYREMAKKNHPDSLRAQGLPDEMIVIATKKMAEINAAWEIVKSSRDL